MRVFEQQAIAALTLLATALFVSAGLPVAPLWRRWFKITAISVFLLALLVVVRSPVGWPKGWITDRAVVELTR